MIFVGLFAVMNVLVVLFMRSDQVQGTPAQVRDWTIKALVAADAILVILVVFSILAWWAGQIRAYQMARGLAPKMPKWRPPPPEASLRRLTTRVIPMLAWLVASLYLIGWLTRTGRLSFEQRSSLWSAANLALVIVLIVLRFRSDPAFAGRIRAACYGASRPKRAFRTLFLLWPFIFMALLCMALLFPRVLYVITRGDLWLQMGLFVATGLSGPLILLLGIIFSARRH